MRFMIILAVLTGLCGCRSLGTAGGGNNDGRAVPALIPYQLKAMEYEERDDLQLALTHWRIAEALMNERITLLTERIGDNAERHFQKGLTLLNTNQAELASLEFLKTLRYDSNHADALRLLKTATLPRRIQEYTVKKGDSFKAIAGQVYKNSSHDGVVAFFSGVDEKDLVEGQVLSLPVLEVEFTRRFFNFSKEIGQARKYFKSRDYRQVIPIAENILKHMPDNKEAKFLINSSCDGLAEQLVQKQKYAEAVEMLKRIDPMFRNVKHRILKIERIQARLQAADTENKNAAHYRKGRELFKEGMYVDALAAFEHVDPTYADVQDKLIELKTLMKNESEIHYRNGVKHFLNEKLDEAIKEWEQALSLDPENAKVQKDIDNAVLLLKKINEIN